MKSQDFIFIQQAIILIGLQLEGWGLDHPTQLTRLKHT